VWTNGVCTLPDPEIKKMLENYEAKVEANVNRVVGTNSVNLTACKMTMESQCWGI
jgi:2',3'-cyclic-nucleotide 2'-phosphodiesterase (5'-nucleotidase family)